MRAVGVFLLWVAILCGAAGAEVTVRLIEPGEGQPVFGEVEVVIEAYATDEEVSSVEVFLDGRSVGELARPPWRTKVAIEAGNRRHRIEVVARGSKGGEARDSVLVQSFRVDDVVDLELQQLYVTVTRSGRRVLGLGKDDFTVLDRGRRQEIVTLAFGDIPFTAILLIDGSVSMDRPLAKAARRGAKALMAGMTPLDEAKAMLFSDHLVAATPFTSDPAVLGAVFAEQSSGGTALNDHLYWAVRLLERRNGRRVVVLLSDGRDVHSVLDMEQVRQAALRGQTMIYWVRLILGGQGGPVSTNLRTLGAGRRQLELLHETVEESGGRILTSRDGADVETALAEILRDLREQYAIGYYPDPALDDGSWRPVAVDLRGGGMKVRTVAGYVDYGPSDD